MTPEQYERIQQAFLRIRDLSPDQRAAQLALEDEDVGREVASLLENESKCGGFLEHGLGPGDATAPIETSEQTTSDRIGRYRLLQRIGEGGHGSVYMAEQTEPIARKVAMKLIKPGMDSKQILARFHAERQALAMMDHPSIASVLDAGTTDTGSPYFVMELVKGIPIDEFCETNELNLEARLTLFLQVCRAVHHAHRRGIIHRDLKPSNVLVTMGEQEPIAKVIDFGIAKALDTRLTQQTLFTEYGQMIGTLEYMSPEQAEMSAVDIDTRSDVYSLGVLLYQLLTGETPISKDELLRNGVFEIPRRLRETDPATPSSRMTTRQQTLRSRVDRSVRGLPSLPRSDLDWIVMKALSKDRRDRYDSAIDFARDLERFLNGNAVDAHPQSLAYRFNRFIRRHRVAAVVAVLVSTSALVGVAGLTMGLRRARVAERQATRSARELASSMYSDMIASAWNATMQHDRAKATRLLQACPEQLRGWEWDFANNRLNDQSDEVLRAAGGSPIRDIGVNPAADQAACVLDNGQVEVWDLAGRQSKCTIAVDFDVNTLTFSRDLKALVLGTSSGRLVTLQTGTWEQQRSRQLGLGGIYSIDVDRDGRRIAVCTGGGWVEVLDVATLQTRAKWKLPSRVGCVKFLDDERLVASGLDGHAYLMSIGDDGHATSFVSEASLRAMEVIDERTFVVLTAGRALAVDSLDDEKAPKEILVCEGLTSALAFDESDRVWVGCGDGSLLMSANDESSTVNRFGTAITALKTIGDRLLVALSDGRLLRVSIEEPTDDAMVPTHAPITTGVLLPKTGVGVLCDEQGWMRLVDLKTGQVRSECKAHQGGVWSISADDAETVLATVGDDQRLRCWELSSFELRFERAIDWGVRDVVVAPDGGWIASAPPLADRLGENEGAIAIWDAATGVVQRRLEGHDNWVLKFVATGDGSKLVSSCENRETRIWDLTDSTQPVVIKSEAESPAEYIAVDEAETTLFLGHRDGWVTSWSLSDGTRRAKWPAFGDAISGLAVTHDDRVLATSRSDPRLRVIDTSLDRVLGEFDLGLGYVTGSRLSKDDRFLSIVGQDRDVVLLSVDREPLQL